MPIIDAQRSASMATVVHRYERRRRAASGSCDWTSTLNVSCLLHMDIVMVFGETLRSKYCTGARRRQPVIVGKLSGP
jgi:hypothetical protein